MAVHWQNSMLASPEEVESFAIRLLAAAGVARRYAEVTASNLLFGNLRGIDSHGVRLLTYYVPHLRAGTIRPDTQGHAIREAASLCVYDADSSLGAASAEACCEIAIRLATAQGIGMVTARHANHFGPAGFWAKRIAAAGHIGLAFCNASPIVAPWQAKEPRYGTNPISMAVPGNQFLLDMATTTVAANRIFKAYQTGETAIPEGWAMDREGRPTTDTAEAYSGLIAPLGGYKGTGLAMMVEILTSVLAGGAIGTEVGGIRFTDRPVDVSHSFLAIDVEMWMPRREFDARLDKLASMVHSAAPAAGYDEVLVAGEPEERIEAERRLMGIPIPAADAESLQALARELNVDPIQSLYGGS